MLAVFYSQQMFGIDEKTHPCVIITPHYYSHHLFCLAPSFLSPFMSRCVYYHSPVPTAVYDLHKVSPHDSLSYHQALTHDPDLPRISVKTCCFWVAAKMSLSACFCVSTQLVCVDDVNRCLSVLSHSVENSVA